MKIKLSKNNTGFKRSHSGRTGLICGNPLKSINTNLAEFYIYFSRPHTNLQLALFHILSLEPPCERKSCLAQYFLCEAITAVESSYQLASVDFYLCTSHTLSFSLSLPAWTRLYLVYASVLLSPSLPPSSLSSYVCLCPSVCLYTLTLSSLPSQHCSSCLPESQPLLSIPHSSHYHPLNEVRWRKIEIDREETGGEKKAGGNKRGKAREC